MTQDPAQLGNDLATQKAQLAAANEMLRREMAEKAAVEAEALGRMFQQEVVADLGQHALAGVDLDTLMAEAANNVALVLDVEMCKVLELLPDGQQLLLRAGVGWRKGLVGHALVSADPASQPGFTLATNAPVIVANWHTEKRFTAPPLLRAHGVISGLSVVIHCRDRSFGILGAHTTRLRSFTEQDAAFLQSVANTLGLARARNSAEEKLRHLNVELEQRVADRTAQLVEANAELQAFAYSVAHDLRAPLRAMQGFSQALLEDYGPQLNTTGQDYARRIAAAAQDMDALIQDLLAYCRIARADLPRQVVNLEVVVESACQQLAKEMTAAGAELAIQKPLPHVVGHQTTLVQIVANLLSNACKFVAPGVPPRIRVCAEARGECVRLWVADNGIGIAPEHHDRIFRVFERLHGVETYAGTGIGLAIVRKGIQRLGGRVGVSSALGEGSQFWVELPKSEE